MRKHHNTPGNREESPRTTICYHPSREAQEQILELLAIYGNRQIILDAAVGMLYKEHTK